MRAEYREARAYPGRRAAEIAVVAAGAACGFRTCDEGAAVTTLSCGINWWSFGEAIEVHRSEVNGALVVDIHSCCRSPTQLEDWGKNRKNVRRLFEALEGQLGTRDCCNVPICARCGYLLVGIDSEVCPECGVETSSALRSGQSSRRWLSALKVFAALTAIELLLINAAHAFSALPSGGVLFLGVGGAVRLAVINVGVLAVLVVLPRVWKPNG
jgi:hypothetical protein